MAHGKATKECTKEENGAELGAQLKGGLGDSSRPVLTGDNSAHTPAVKGPRTV